MKDSFTSIDHANLDTVHGGVRRLPIRPRPQQIKPLLEQGWNWLKEKARQAAPYIKPRPIGSGLIK